MVMSTLDTHRLASPLRVSFLSFPVIHLFFPFHHFLSDGPPPSPFAFFSFLPPGSELEGHGPNVSFRRFFTFSSPELFRSVAVPPSASTNLRLAHPADWSAAFYPVFFDAFTRGLHSLPDPSFHHPIACIPNVLLSSLRVSFRISAVTRCEWPLLVLLSSHSVSQSRCHLLFLSAQRLCPS